jgi:hypothetical protein
MGEFKDTYTLDVSDYVKGLNEIEQAELKRQQRVKEELQDIEELKRRRAEATNPKEIEDYNKRIAESAKTIKTLTTATEGQSKAQADFAKQMEATKKANEQVKASFSNLKSTILAQLPGAEITGFGQQIFQLADGAKGLATGFNSASGATKAFKVALASTGIGLIVVALGSLISFLTQTQDGLDKVRKFTSQVGTGFAIFTDILSEVGKVVFEFGDILLFPIKNLFNLGKAVTRFLSGDFAGSADALKDSFDEVSNIISEFPKKLEVLSKAGENISKIYAGATANIEEAGKLTDRLIANERALAEFAVRKVAAEAEIKKLNLLGEDQSNRDFKARIAALEKTNEITRAIRAENERLLEEKFNIQVAQNALSNSLQKDTEKEFAAKIELESFRIQSYELETTQNAKLNGVKAQQAAADRAVRNEELISLQEISALKTKGLEDFSQKVELQNEKNIKANEAERDAYIKAQFDKAKADQIIDEGARKREEQRKKEAQEIANIQIAALQNVAAAGIAIKANQNAFELQSDLSRVEQLKNAELANKELTDEQKLAIQKKYDAENAKLQAEAFRKQKNLKRAEILINAAVAAIDILAKSPDITKPLGPLYNAQLIGLGIATGAQLAILESQKFADGTDRVRGGIKGRDSVRALLMPDEAVIKAKENMKYPGLSKAFNEGRIEDFIYKNWVVPTLDKELSQIEELKQRSFADNLMEGLQLNATLKDGNILTSLQMTRKEQRKTNELLSRIANKTKRSSYHKWN